MGECDAEQGRRLVQKRGFYKQGYWQKDEKQDQGSQYIKGKMDNRRPFGVFRGAKGGEQRRRTGADILSHNNRHGGTVGDLSRGRERLQNTDGGGA